MPPPVRRLASLLAAPTLLALVLASAAAAGNGGIAPPDPASPGAAHIRDIYWLILGITGGIFVLVEGALILFMIKYRSRGRPREVEGPQIRGHTNLELAWTAGPVVILAIIAGFVFYKVSAIEASSTAPAEQIRVEGHQFYWEFVYPDGTIAVDHLRLPYNRVVRLKIVGSDVNHSWWVPALGGKLDAIPGKTNTMTFRPSKLGTFKGQCAEFCGIQHAAMIARVDVLPQSEYDAWVQKRRSSTVGPRQGDVRRRLRQVPRPRGAGGHRPADRAEPAAPGPHRLDHAATQRNRHHAGRGQDWNDTQLNALLEYLAKRFKGGGGGG